MLTFWKNNRSLLVTLSIVVLVLAVLSQGLEARVSASILLSGITLAAIFFMIASGLSLIFGLMDVLNFAHGALFVLGAYIGLSAFANPRFLFNVFPLFLAAGGGILLAFAFHRQVWRHLRTNESQDVARWVLLAIGLGIVAFSLRRFPIGLLNAFYVTAVGGSVPTSIAQEPLGLMVQRLGLLFAGSLPLGIAMAPRAQFQENGRLAAGRFITAGLGLLVVGLLILFARDVGEQAWLGLSVNVRFILALFLGSVVSALAGVAIEIGLIRPFYGSPVTQLVLTLGLSIVSINLIELVWGKEGQPPMEPPTIFTAPCRSESLLAWFSEHCRSIDVLGRAFPTYRLFIIFMGVMMFLAVGLLLQRSRLGMIIRAGVQDSEMVQALGINVRTVFTFVFALGSAMAGLGGVIVSPFLGVYPAMGSIFLLQAFIAVVIGGMGSFTGAALGTLLLGLARAFGDHFVAAGISLPFLESTFKGSPAIARASTVLIMAIVLLFRPAGIFGKKE